MKIPFYIRMVTGTMSLETIPNKFYLVLDIVIISKSLILSKIKKFKISQNRSKCLKILIFKQFKWEKY